MAQFSDSTQVIRIGKHLLWVAAGFQAFDAINTVLRAILRGAGDVRVPALQAIFSAWMLTPPLTWLLGFHLGWGALGGWLGVMSDMMFGAVFLALRMLRGGWRRSADDSRTRLAASERASLELSA
jgi:MATE family multidrug resistance protein